MMKLTATNIKYLIVINRLYNAQTGVRCTDVADALKVSKLSVHRMTEAMKNMGIVDKDSDRRIIQTPAERIRRHSAIGITVIELRRGRLCQKKCW